MQRFNLDKCIKNLGVVFELEDLVKCSETKGIEDIQDKIDELKIYLSEAIMVIRNNCSGTLSEKAEKIIAKARGNCWEPDSITDFAE